LKCQEDIEEADPVYICLPLKLRQSELRIEYRGLLFIAK